MKALFTFICILFFAGTLTSQSTICFTQPDYLNSGYRPQSVVAADFNGDGHMDLASGNFGGTDVSVAFGNGNGTFGAPTLYTVGITAGGQFTSSLPHITKGDFNSDGKMDIASANYYYASKQLSVLINNGNGTFAAAANYSTNGTGGPGGPTDIASGDFNHDGKTDLAVLGGTYDLSVFLGNGSGVFTAYTTYTLAGTANSLLCEKINNDGNDDLVIAYTNSIAVLFSNASGVFAAPVYYPYGSYYITSADFNNDSFEDLVLGSTILMGSSSGTFAPTNYSLAAHTGIAASDFDGDGIQDLVINIPNNFISILSGLGNGFFAPAITYTNSLASEFAQTICADLDNDNKADVIFGSFTGSDYVKIMLNKTFSLPATASPTTVCTGFSGTLSATGGATSYSWSTGANGSTVSVMPLATTVYSVTGTHTAGCSATQTVALHVDALPVLTLTTSNDSICTGITVTLSANGASSYTWDSGVHDQSITITPATTTVYTLTGTGANGCTNSVSVSQNVFLCTGITNVAAEKNEIKLYPNPSAGIFFTDLPLEGATLEIFNSLGQSVLKETDVNYHSEINLTKQPDGLYFVRVFKNTTELGYVKLIKR